MSRLRDFSAVFEAPHPLVFAHRGGAGLGPENTLVAFARGLAAGADGIECDVRLSKDGVPVVIHDPTLERTTDASGPVSRHTAAELAGLDASCRFVPAAGLAPPPRAGVPALADLLHTFQRPRCIIELKDDNPALAEAVADVVAGAGAEARVCVGSFHGRVLRRLREVAPEVTTSASLGEAKATLWRSWLRWPHFGRPPYRAFQVPERSGRLRVVTAPFVRQVHRERAVIQVWTVNDPADVVRLLALGVDGVISDRPDLAVAARDVWVTARDGVRATPDSASGQ